MITKEKKRKKYKYIHIMKINKRTSVHSDTVKGMVEMGEHSDILVS